MLRRHIDGLHDWQRAIGSLARLTILSVVESVGADGTIEGSSSDSVARRNYGADSGGAIGYVRLG